MRLLIVLFLFAVAGVPLAYAHPFTEETTPIQFSNAPVGTAEVIVRYSEAVEIEFSRLEVLDSNGDRVDNGDTSYYEGDSSLIVTTPPLEEGVYTVTSKVLSRVDGHLVPDAFIFGIGDVVLPDESLPDTADLIFLPEALARFPGLVGQTVVLGAVIASLLVWGGIAARVGRDAEQLHARYHGKFMILVGVGLVAVFVSNILILAVQMWRLEAPVLDVLQTGSGGTWTIRMGTTAVLFGMWFALERAGKISHKFLAPMLAVSMLLIATTTMMGHGAASEQPYAVALDYAHNMVAAIWIGGVIFLTFALLPSLTHLKAGRMNRLALAALPRFSSIVVISLGVVIVSGPLLLYLLESDLGVIAGSTYGRLIVLKILIASAMVGIGAYHQFGVQRKAESEVGFPVHGRLRRTLKVESALGVALLFAVALLTNGTLPAGEVQTAEARQQPSGLSISEFSEGARFDIQIRPFTPGVNEITAAALAHDGSALQNLTSLKIKVSNPGKGIFPIEVPVEASSGGDYRGEITFGFSGDWQLEIEAQRSRGGNEGIAVNLPVKPRLENLRAEVVEYEFPKPGAPLYPVYDGRGSIWISDASAPRIWKYDIGEGSFAEYVFEGQASLFLAIDSDSRVWFTDTPEGRIGFVDPETGEHVIVELPNILPFDQRSLPVLIETAPDGSVWTSIVNKNTILRYDHSAELFKQFAMPTEDSGPFAVRAGPDGRIWFTQQAVGQFGYIEQQTGNVVEISPGFPLGVPETITFDRGGNLWISEHQEGGSITRYDPLLETFLRVPAPGGAALPNSAALDRYQNVWFAQHTIDSLAVYDPHRGDLMEVPIPTAGSWVQFTTLDGDGNVWFVEQQPYKLGTVKLTELPGGASAPAESATSVLRYAELAGPLMATGVVAASLFFVKSVRDERRINAATGAS